MFFILNGWSVWYLSSLHLFKKRKEKKERIESKILQFWHWWEKICGEICVDGWTSVCDAALSCNSWSERCTKESHCICDASATLSDSECERLCLELLLDLFLIWNNSLWAADSLLSPPAEPHSWRCNAAQVLVFLYFYWVFQPRHVGVNLHTSQISLSDKSNLSSVVLWGTDGSFLQGSADVGISPRLK